MHRSSGCMKRRSERSRTLSFLATARVDAGQSLDRPSRRLAVSPQLELQSALVSDPLQLEIGQALELHRTPQSVEHGLEARGFLEPLLTFGFRLLARKLPHHRFALRLLARRALGVSRIARTTEEKLADGLTQGRSGCGSELRPELCS